MPSLESEILSTSPVGKMPRHLFKIVLALICLLSFVEPSMSQSLRVVESTFCIDMDNKECITPADSKEISRSVIRDIEDGIPRLSFWTKLQVLKKDAIAHIWIPLEYPLQVSSSIVEGPDRIDYLMHMAPCLSLEFLKLNMKRFVSIPWLNLKKLKLPKKLHPTIDRVLGVCLGAQAISKSFRTHSNIKAEPGTYSVVVIDSDKNIIPGGDVKTIKVVP